MDVSSNQLTFRISQSPTDTFTCPRGKPPRVTSTASRRVNRCQGRVRGRCPRGLGARRWDTLRHPHLAVEASALWDGAGSPDAVEMARLAEAPEAEACWTKAVKS
ncbi:lysine methyltransferase, partial [Metarhizium brunneum ARSEF 3297]